MEKTDWNRPPSRPTRPGLYPIAVYDSGWIYEHRAFWNGSLWLDKEGGNSLIDQNISWRPINQPKEDNVSNTAELVVKIGQLSNQLDEKSARGFKENAAALNLVSELKDVIELLETLAFKEFQ
jgi:hypothetical protein